MRTRVSGHVLLAAFLVLMGQSFAGQAGAATNELWFHVGEDLQYRAYWGLLPVGDARLWTEWVEENGRKLLAIRLKAGSSAVISAVYPVEDWIESVVDPVTFLPVRFTQNVREGRRHRADTIAFDHAAGRALCASSKTGKTRELKIDPDTRDVLSFIYFMRSKGFGEGQKENFKVVVDGKVYDMGVTGLKFEKVYLSQFGNVRCLELEPRAEFGEIFVRKGSINMWFSDDGRRICTKALVVVPVANIKAILRHVDGPGDDFWTSGRRAR